MQMTPSSSFLRNVSVLNEQEIGGKESIVCKIEGRGAMGEGESEMEVWYKKKAKAGCLAGSHEKQANVCSATRARPLLSSLRVTVCHHVDTVKIA